MQNTSLFKSFGSVFVDPFKQFNQQAKQRQAKPTVPLAPTPQGSQSNLPPLNFTPLQQGPMSTQAPTAPTIPTFSTVGGTALRATGPTFTPQPIPEVKTNDLVDRGGTTKTQTMEIRRGPGGTPPPQTVLLGSQTGPTVPGSQAPGAQQPQNPISQTFDAIKQGLLNLSGGLANFGQQPEAPQVPGAPQTAPAGLATPQIPNIEPTLKAVSDAEAAYQQSLRVSPEELSTQADVDALIESTKKAFRNTQDQPIPLEFITGQLSSIERRALGLAEPLEKKLARLQAARQSSIEASKFSLERQDKKLEGERDRALKEREFQEGARRFGVEQAGAAEGRQIQRETIQQSQAQFEQKLEQDRKQFGDELAFKKNQADIENKLSQQKFNEDVRQFGMENALKSREVALKEKELLDKGRGSYQQEQANIAVNTIDDLLPRVNNRTVGFGAFTAAVPGEARDFQADVDQLKASIAFRSLQAMRDASQTGGALGQVSERELKLLESALGALDTKQRPENFKKNLQKIKDSLTRWNQAMQTYGTPGGAAGTSGQTSSGLKYEIIP